MKNPLSRKTLLRTAFLAIGAAFLATPQNVNAAEAAGTNEVQSISATREGKPQLGDYMLIGDVPCYVFYLDETGEHGLAMSFPLTSVRKKKFGAYVDSCASTGLIRAELADKYKDGTLLFPANINIKIPQELCAKLTNEGKKNQETIVAYCQENNVELSNFPHQFWASQLGDGWFIPGYKELELFAKFYTGGLGKEHKVGLLEKFNIVKSRTTDKRVQGAIYSSLFWGILSSTSEAKNWKKGFEKLGWAQHNAMNPNEWLVMYSSHSSGFVVCAVHEF